jgi:class 3 adenylate cyclase
MTNRFLSILIIEPDNDSADHLNNSILGNGNNPIRVENLEKAMEIVQNRNIGLILINLEYFAEGTKLFVHNVKSLLHFKSPWFIGYVSDEAQINKSYFNLNLTDLWLTGSLHFMREKIENWKQIYFERRRVDDFFAHLYPETIISDFYDQKHTDPKKIHDAAIMFTDFVEFSFKTKTLTPERVAKKLTKYFNRFDEIIRRYRLEKVKTIGDAYMVIGGVSESNPNPIMRMCLAALEIRNYMETQKAVSQAFNRDFWEVRIGIHQGPLVAGIIGKTKFHFDVWGDSVNIAARTEKASTSNTILITEQVNEQVKSFFQTTSSKTIEVAKRGGKLNLFELQDFNKNANSLIDFLKNSNLEIIDFKKARNLIIRQLKSLLPVTCAYHNLKHSLDVERACIRYANVEGISEHEKVLLRTAALLHDVGFIHEYENNEYLAVQFASLHLPEFGYSSDDISIIVNCVLSTNEKSVPQTNLEKILCDSDLDYLGREDYFEKVQNLRLELSNFGHEFTEKSWIDFQLNFLENKHKYYTNSAKNIRGMYKEKRILELKKTRSILA